MAQATHQPDVPPAIERKLAQVRRGIRAYVWLEGLAAIAIALGAAFWVGLWLDWMFEPAPAVRLAAMIGVAGLGSGSRIVTCSGARLCGCPTPAWPCCWSGTSPN